MVSNRQRYAQWCLASAALAFGCGGGPFAATASKDKADDLIGRQVTVEARAPERNLTLPARETVTMSVSENEDDSILITTDDIRFKTGDATQTRVGVDTESQPNTARYAFILEYRVAGGEWIRALPPIEGDYYWETVYIRGGQIAGVAVRVSDWLGGLSTSSSYRSISTFDLPQAALEFRALVLPNWNFWDWDADGYTTTLSVY